MLVRLLSRPTLSQRGNALLIVLSLSAFVGVIATEMYRRGETTAQRSQQNIFKEDTKIVLEAIASNIQNPDTCTRLFYGQIISPGLEANVTLNYKYEDATFHPTETTFTVGTEITNGVVAEHVALFTGGVAEMTTRIAELPTPIRRYRASLRTVFRNTAVGKLASVNWRTDILGNDLGLPLFVWVDDNNAIMSCFGINSAGAACNMSLGYYHVPNPAGPALAHNLSCRQTVMFRPDDQLWNPPVVPSRGACRYGGVRPAGSCPASSFAPGSPFAVPIQDAWANGGNVYTPMDACAQCQ